MSRVEISKNLYNLYELKKENKDTLTLPVDDWYWFESEEEARTFFNLPKEEEKKEDTRQNPRLKPKF